MTNFESSYESTALGESLDQTILRIFRIFAGIRLSIALLLFAVESSMQDNPSLGRALAITDALLLIAFLSLPILRLRLGRFYLPIALVWASIAPILIQRFTIWNDFQNVDAQAVSGAQILDLETFVLKNVIDWILLATVGQLFLALMAPLIIVAWCYHLPYVIYFCVATAVLDIVTTLVAIPLYDSQILLLIGLVVARTFILLLIGSVINRLVTQQKQQQEDLLRANQQLQHYALAREKLAISQERNRLARELHDTLAHTLSATTVQLEAIGLILEKQPDKARDLLVQATSRTREGLNETRRALDALRVAPIENMGLQKALALLAESATARYGIEIDTHFNDGTFTFDPEDEHNIYRILQEAINNAARHASPKQITIQADCFASYVTFSVSDDGVGFDLPKGLKNGRYGLRGMQERAQQMNARLEINSQIGFGTKIILNVET